MLTGWCKSSLTSCRHHRDEPEPNSRRPVPRVHLCREHPCRAEVDVALHAIAYAPIDRDHPLDLRGESNPTPRRCRLSIASMITCIAWMFRQTSLVGYRTGHGFSRLGSWCCCCARRSPADGSTPGEWKDSLSESESEPEGTRCHAHLVLCASPSGEASGFASKRCWDRAFPAAARPIEEDACASGLGLTGSEPGTARLCHCHAKAYELARVKLKCAYQACYQLGTVHVQGLTLCGEHAQAHLRAKPDPQGGTRGLPLTVGTTRSGTVTPPDLDNPPLVGFGAGERHGEPTAVGGVESHPDRWLDLSGFSSCPEFNRRPRPRKGNRFRGTPSVFQVPGGDWKTGVTR